MAKAKTTIVVERSQIALARELTGADSTSAVIGLALERLIRAERLRRDVAAYERTPPNVTERAVGAQPVTFDLGDDEVDYGCPARP